MNNLDSNNSSWVETQLPNYTEKYQRRAPQFHFGNLRKIIDISLYINSHSISIEDLQIGTIMYLFGRIESIRIHQSITFISLQFNIQISLMGENKIKYNFLEVGDIVYANGEVVATKQSVSLSVNEIYPTFPMLQELDNTRSYYLSKTENVEGYKKVLYNSQYYNNVRKNLQNLLQSIREFSYSIPLREVIVPTLSNFIYGGNELTPFSTFCQHLNRKMYLSSAPESFLKQMIVLGEFNGVFTICPAFRNEQSDKTHHYEFMTYEAYWNNSDNDMVLNIFKNNLFPSLKLKFNSSFEIKEYILIDLVNKYVGKNFLNLSLDEIKIIFDDMNLIYDFDVKSQDMGVLAYEIFDQYIIDREFDEKNINIVKYMPNLLTPFAEKYDEIFSDSSEIYWGKIEGINMYTECSNPMDQYNQALKSCRNDRANFDTELMDALFLGMGITCGAGIGINRLASFLFNTPFEDFINFKK